MRTCTIDECDKKYIALGLCDMHYRRMRHNGSPLTVKRCVGKDREQHPLYSRYKDMKKRCYNPKCHQYKDYGGRGIKISDEWLEVTNGFELYAAHIEALPNAYRPTYTIDRINNDGDYEFGNVRWADRITQSRNQRELRSDNKSGFVGIMLMKNKWYVRVNKDGKRKQIGVFKNLHDAVSAQSLEIGIEK